MKTLLLLLVICALQYYKCDDGLASRVRQYPKKFQTPMSRSIKIINARKFDKLRISESRKAIYKKKDKKVDYTAFPQIVVKKIKNSAESFHRQGLSGIDRTPRVKKVLPEYGLSVFRRKRSADTELNNTETGKKIKRRRNFKNKNRGLRNGKHARRNVSGIGDKQLNKISKFKSKHINGEVTYVYRKQKIKNNKTTLPAHLKLGRKRSTVNLKYTANDGNKTGSNIKGEKSIKRNKKSRRQRKLKRRERRKVGYRRLIAGRDAMITEYPYVVSIQKGGYHWCAGALLNQKLVITTANCIWKSTSVSRMKIRAGTRHVDRGGQVAKILEVVKHPLWSIRSGPDNDVGLLLLDRNIKFSDRVHSVDLPNHAMWPAFEDVWVTSWGSNRRDGVWDSMSKTLQVYHAMLISHTKCNNATMRFGVPVTRNFICVAQTGRRAPCTRDTGAPAVSDGILWGIASWGIRKLCGTERFPAMFSYLASKSNLDFITSATNRLMSDKRHYPYNDRFTIRSNDPTTTSS